MKNHSFQDKMTTRLEKYKNANEFVPNEGGKAKGVFLILFNKKFPNDDIGCCGLFHKSNKNTPLFTRIENSKVIATYNLQSYVAVDVYGEPFIF